LRKEIPLKTFLRLSLGALLALPLAAEAQWEGALEMKISGKDVTGSSKALIGKAGARMQMEMTNAQLKEAGQGSMKMTVLSRTVEPDTSYLINDAQKSYALIDLKAIQEMATKSEREKKWTVKRLGADKVAGYACERALVNQEGSETDNEVCVSKEIMGSAGLFNAGRRDASEQGLEKALKANGLEGMPIRMIVREKGKAEATMTWELVKAEKRPLPASTFEVPAGYRETSAMGVMLSPDQQKQMDDAMKNMTPEQRKMIEEMMKKKGGSR
jgi:hypothetical protein